MLRMRTIEFIRAAKKAVYDYALQHLDKSDIIPDFSVYVVWSCSGDNHKAMLSTTLFDGMYYEVVYFCNLDEVCITAYKKYTNRTILEGQTISGMDDFIEKCSNDIRRYVFQMQELTNSFMVYPTWLTKVLQNWKAMYKTTDTRNEFYFEVTFNGDKDEAYLDVYKYFDSYELPADMLVSKEE